MRLGKEQMVRTGCFRGCRCLGRSGSNDGMRGDMPKIFEDTVGLVFEVEISFVIRLEIDGQKQLN